MPEWQGAGVGTTFLNAVMQYHLEGNGRCGHKYPTFFHTSHPQLCSYLRHSKKWIQNSARLFGDNKVRCNKSMLATSKGFPGEKQKNKKTNHSGGYGGHFRAIQGFKYIGDEK